mmetsp:Transcript_15825/g.37287  ORF Transcript_15825/g.37287 Transcript_15825/m.37287 type:complete len:1068 (+) Transcript_15825:39-3242(+)
MAAVSSARTWQDLEGPEKLDLRCVHLKVPHFHTRSPRATSKIYDFVVVDGGNRKRSGLADRSREANHHSTSVHSQMSLEPSSSQATLSEQQSLHLNDARRPYTVSGHTSGDEELMDEHSCVVASRSSFRTRRAQRFRAWRPFPVLVNPRLLPSAAEPPHSLESRTSGPSRSPRQRPKSQPSTVLQTTLSTERKRQAKVSRDTTLKPFRPNSCGKAKDVAGLFCRTPGLPGEEYRATSSSGGQAFRVASRDGFLYGDFLPSSPRPPRALSPLSSNAGHQPPWAWPASRGDPVATYSSGFSVELLRDTSASTPARALQEERRKTVTKVSEDGDHLDGKQSVLMTGALAAGKQEFERRQAQEEAARTADLNAFSRLADDNKIHRSDLSRALVMLGHAKPEQQWINDAASAVTKYVTMDFGEFRHFLRCYEHEQRNAHKEAFKQVDEDGSGDVDLREMQELLRSVGFEPLRHVLEEVLAEVDEDKSGALNFIEFEQVMRLLKEREGFTKSEFRAMKELFVRFDRTGSGSMTVSEVNLAFEWLGFTFSEELVEELITNVDADKSGTISQGEWLMLLRDVREAKIKELAELVLEYDHDRDGTIQYQELMPLLRSLGFTPSLDAVHEAAAAAGINDDTALDVGELWRLLTVYRDHEGLTNAELAEIDEACLACGWSSKESEVDVLEVGRIIRAMGFPLPFEARQNLIAKVDIDCSGKLDRHELRKMVRMIIQQDVELFRKTFARLRAGLTVSSRRASEASQMSQSELPQPVRPSILERSTAGALEAIEEAVALQGLEEAGCLGPAGGPPEFEPDDIASPGFVNIWGFCQAGRRGRQYARQELRKQGGMSRAEIEALKQSFDRYDADGSGQIDGAEIIAMLEEEFPALTQDPSRRPQMAQLLKDADRDGSGTLDFGDFLLVMSQLKDVQDQLRVAKELKAVVDTKFSQPEVAEFRELFLTATAANGEDASDDKELGFEEIKKLLSVIVPMGTKNVVELKQSFDETAKMQMGAPGDAEKLDFPEFLWLMRALLDKNFANMGDRAAKAANREAVLVRASSSQESDEVGYVSNSDMAA